MTLSNTLKKIFPFSIFLILITLLLLSCKKDPAPELNIAISSLTVQNKSGSEKVTFTCNGKWSVSSSETWFTVSPSFGNGNGEVTVTYTDNQALEERKGNINFTTGTLAKTLKITQSRTHLDIDNQTLSFTKESAGARISIVSNSDWQVIIPQGVNWVTASPMSGSQNMDVNFVISANTGAIRTADIAIKYAQSEKIVSITQQRGINSPPLPPALKLPTNNNTDASRLPSFRWSASKDPDNDQVVYSLEYSKNGTNWTVSNQSQDTIFYLPAYLDANTNYSWRVKATDSMGESVYSQTNTFRTGTKVSYFDGEYKVALSNTAGISPSEILFIGDGYTAEDYIEGGKFDQEVEEGINYLFSTEPYKSYKQYFKVYKQAGYSRDQGVTQTDKSITKNTKFGVSFNGGSSMESNSTVVFSTAKLIPGVDDIKLRELLIVLLVNENRYAGTCWTWSDGKTIAITPVSRNSNLSYHYKGVLLHEAGGHGFGRLADEYISSSNAGKTISAEDTQKLKDRFSKNHAANVDLTPDFNLVRWKHFIGKPGYERVTIIEGAYYYPFGVWRPEQTSCMINNIGYYNAPSREAIVKRILEKAGETYVLDNFIGNDITKEPAPAALLQTKSFNPLTFVPLSPPVFVK